MNFEKIKKFIFEKIFHQKDQRLLMPATSISKDCYDGKIDLSSIFEYIDKEKYIKDFHITFTEISANLRKKLIKKIEEIEKEEIDFTNDDNLLTEGIFSKEHFISVGRKTVRDNKIRQTIVTENLYIDISTKKKYKSLNYNDLQYKEYIERNEVKELYEFDEENESYYREIRKNRNYIYRICIIW